MRTIKHDIIVGLAGIGHGEGSDTEARALHAAELWHRGVAPHILATGVYPILLRDRPHLPYSRQMVATLRKNGVDDEHIICEDDSLTTIENFLKSRKLLADFRDIALVTSQSHAIRSEETGGHVLGPGFNISSYPAPASHEPRQGIQEVVGGMITRLCFRGTEPGDHDAIAANHELIFPGEGRDRIFTPLEVVANSARALLLP